MTEFRTKGKGDKRRVYPIQKRKPFGIPRKLAYEEVIALRKQGKKARLIKTNQRLDLYAPYEALPVNGSESVDAGTESRQTSSIQDSKRTGEVVQITANEIQTVKDQIIGSMPKGYRDVSVYSRGGRTYVSDIDPSHIMMVYASLAGETSVEEFPSGTRFRIPELRYDHGDSAMFLLHPDQQKILMKEIRGNKDAVDVVFHKPENGHNAYVFLRGTDPHTNKTLMLGEPIPVFLQNSNQKELTTHLDPVYVKRALRSLTKLNRDNGLKSESMSVRFKDDYPIHISTGTPDREFNALIAPKMEDNSWESVRILNERISQEGVR